MIKTNSGETTIEANGLADLKTDLTVIIRTVVNEMNIMTKEDVLEIVDLACLTDEDLHKKAIEKVKEVNPNLEKLTEEIIKLIQTNIKE